MTPKQRADKLERIKHAIRCSGYSEDRWGNFRREVPQCHAPRTFIGGQRAVLTWSEPKLYRYELTKNSIALQLQHKRQGPFGKTEYSWVRLRSAYIRDVDVVNGRLCGLTTMGCQPKK